eukprot:CAMPEP_0197905844 /NCGR_PEP_ID=MMETSP1439-20131203/61285_1 /TAXON_ID=66791 /ORGANISM="Gonyaulax spinifera, Strain CCMP409" /LENGTH=46 /DNA_ID= /DNA_START= /DNA_END= /DNA_ORIENTATION=
MDAMLKACMGAAIKARTGGAAAHQNILTPRAPRGSHQVTERMGREQ